MKKKKKKIIIHVNQHNVKYNQKHEKKKPIFTVKEGSKNTYCTRVYIDGPSVLVYADDGTNTRKKLSCGAVAWIETKSPVRMENPTTFQEIKKMFSQKHKGAFNL